MRLFILTLFIGISSNVFSLSWIHNDDYQYLRLKFNLQRDCNISIHEGNSSLLTAADLLVQLDSNEISNDKCLKQKDALKSFLKKNSQIIKNKIGFQSDADILYLNDREHKFFDKGNIYFESNYSNNNIAFQFRATKFKNDVIFDNSFVAIKSKNTVFKFGKINRWWSPSENSSLIMSNAAQSPLSLSFSNYNSYSPEKLNFISQINYEVFISKLERNREIPNARLFGNRLNFKLFKEIDISLLRVAQFGGKGRSVNSDVIKNMVLGQDTTNRNLLFNDQPGNQIAGIDFSINLLNNKNIKLYGQYIGEDGLDPIIDDRWIGAIFPSKRFGLVGIKYNFENKYNPSYLVFEHINTDTGFKNITYNHALYKTGYRYKGFPIGESMDTDSHRSLISYKKIYNDHYFKVTYSKMDINQNNSLNTRWGNKNILNDELNFKFSRKFNDKFSLNLVIIKRDLDTEYFAENLFFLNLEQRL